MLYDVPKLMRRAITFSVWSVLQNNEAAVDCSRINPSIIRALCQPSVDIKRASYLLRTTLGELVAQWHQRVAYCNV